jgi:hypothetical protein
VRHSQIRLAISWARNSPIASGDSRSSPAPGCAEPRQVNGDQAGVLGKRRPHRLERADALRPRTGKHDRPLARATCVGVPDPDSADSPEADRWRRCCRHAAILHIRSVLRTREHPGQVPGHPARRRAKRLRCLPGRRLPGPGRRWGATRARSPRQAFPFAACL